MSEAARLATVIRIVAARRDRLGRALEAAQCDLTTAEQRFHAAVTLRQQAADHAARAEDEFRAVPQCPQRQLMRDVTSHRAASASAGCDTAATERDEAAARCHAAARAVAREEARADWLDQLRRKLRAAMAKRAALRDEDDQCARRKAA